jgi:hypothetical protein
LLWRKPKFSASDAQKQLGNPVGGVRLVQAKWEWEGVRVNQTTFFRQVVFGDLDWTVGIHPPKKQEVAVFRATVKILGQDYGVHELSVSHKPSGEAGQHNYTTMLHWKTLMETVRKLNLVGKTLEFYAPAGVDPTNTYHIEISEPST